MASETDMRRHTAAFAPPAADDVPELPLQVQPPDDEEADAVPEPVIERPQSRESVTSLDDRPTTPPVQQQSNKHRRFSVLRFRNASDSQLSLRVKQAAEKPPPVPRPPAIITTAPTMEMSGPLKKSSSRMGLAAMLRRSTDIPRDDPSASRRHDPMPRKSMGDQGRPSLSVTDEPQSPRPSTQTTVDSTGTGLNIAPRPSESSRSDVSSTDRVSHTSLSSTPKKPLPSSSFFKLRRSKKPPEPLFPFAHLRQEGSSTAPTDPSSTTSLGVEATPRPVSAQSAGAHQGELEQGPHLNPAIALFNANGGPRSEHSASPTRTTLLRGRSSTLSSIGRDSNDEHLVPPPNTRSSTSIGRKSFGDLLGLTRLRQNSDLSRQGSFTPATPGSVASKSNSLQLPREESIVLPERLDDESPAKYIARIEGMVSRGVVAAALSKGTDPFSTAALRSFMRTFSFFGDPMDMAIRKLLMEAELPKETQQIDRCLQAFANRYHECNPGIYSSPDQAYFIAFSLLILHTDVFNKNNKHKMQKTDYLKNTRGEGIFDEILECFYDNICYTPFIHVEDDLDMNSERHGSIKSKRKITLPAPPGDPSKRAAKEPLDPYTLIIDGNLDVLRPNLKATMPLEDQYNYLGAGQSLNLKDLQKTFFRTGVLQIVSARSRPDAFMSDNPLNNPDDAPGIVDIKITKVGLLWRKEAKKRKTRSPWQEWGAILTGAQLYFFRNTSWVKNLMHQYESHIKAGHDGIPITFKPPLEEFKPDALMSTKGAVALLDTSYKKHKNAFIYVRQGGLDEVLLADDEHELNDWLAKLNYAAAFGTSGVKMRGVVGGTYDGHSRRAFRRLDSSDATQLVETPTGLVSIARSRIDHKMAQDIQLARREFMQEKIAEADRKIEESKKALENQLRNARHLQILAPIQPRTREQLLLAAARMSAQLRWARMEIWKEICHRDILALDLKEEGDVATTERKSTADGPPPSGEERRVSSASHPSGAAKRPESQSKASAVSEKAPQSPVTENLPSFFSDEDDFVLELQDPARPTTSPPATRPVSEVHPQPEVQETPKLDIGSIRHNSVSSITASPVQPSITTMQSRQQLETHNEDETTSVKSGHTHDEVDADERQLLKQAGLLEGRVGRDPSDKAITSTTGEPAEPSMPGDKFDRSKIRRSLQRTLRESAGHLSHHRSRKGREVGPAASSEDAPRDSTLARGTGSFVVHGKKASVINLGTELQVMSNEEQILARKQQQQSHRQSCDQPVSPVVTEEPDDDFFSVLEVPLEHSESRGRSGSAASASTATARSFRELHRKYSSAQAARSVSAGGRLAIPSDAESEVAVSFSEGRRSPLPPIETEEEHGDDDVEESAVADSVVGEDEEDTTLELEQNEDIEREAERPAQEQDEQEPAKEEAEGADESSVHDSESLPNRPLQAVNA